MWSFLLGVMLQACSTSPSTPAPDAEKAAKADKAKVDKNKAKAKAEMDPIGVAGPATGVLTLTPLTDPPPGTKAPAPGATPPAAPVARTEAKLTITFADGSSKPLPLGRITGTCTETPSPAPVGPAGEQVTPLWAVVCKDPAGKQFDLAILQKGDALNVLRAVPNPAGGAAEHKVVKRVRFAAGVQLSKK